MNKAGKMLKIVYTDSQGNEHVVSSMGCDFEDADVEVQMNQFESEGWGDVFSGTEWTIELEIISWDEVWLIAYHARMYAETFRS